MDVDTLDEIQKTSSPDTRTSLESADKNVGIQEEGVAVSGDKALNLLSDTAEPVDFNPDVARRVKRKIDRRIMPLIFLVYLLQLLDKNSISFANIMGIRKDLNLTDNQYSWLGSLVYFGYLTGDIPASYIMQRVSLVRYFSCACMLWGVVVACTAACRSFASIAVLRFLLGYLEVCTAPAAIMITTSWYTKEEQVLRVSLWYTTSGWGHVFGGLFAYALNHARHFKWEGLFVLLGGLTFSMGVFSLFFLSATPTEASWLTQEEKIVALERVRQNKTGTEIWKFNKIQLFEALRDPRFYLVFFTILSTGIPNGGYTAFGPSIIAQFGFNVNETTLLNMGSGACLVVGILLAYVVARFTNRTVAGLYTLALSIVGTIMILVIDKENYRARYGGYVLSQQYAICVLFVITYITAGVGGATKKFAFHCAYQLGYAIGNIVGPQTFRKKDAPNYRPAKWTMVAFISFTFALFAAIGAIHWYWNRQRDLQDEKDAKDGVEHPVLPNEEFRDLSDWQIRSFRYPL